MRIPVDTAVTAPYIRQARRKVTGAQGAAERRPTSKVDGAHPDLQVRERQPPCRKLGRAGDATPLEAERLLRVDIATTPVNGAGAGRRAALGFVGRVKNLGGVENNP